MQITKELVGYVAELSRIELDEAQTEKMQQELGAIVEYMDILSTLDTTETEPLSHIFAITNVMREDEVRPSADNEDIMKNLPETEDGMPVVPRTID
ncbi:MAG: Asp-tRNA(Asn)/Glu-tRNA(Gln) amidotransferase subunit GatC [Firmicutes bacterium]|nr:Asp-tRNA(Asn)/Glu-tRNA(Gln) amidotransferase subunit GatC [Bacillota bacterium]MDD7601495.1 Asp-tRNA(Asn)/Glu-tRNA(Gln) amidotransferase subunit GatC [Bacillota bacterium]MDY5857067.1 Asp-tRNA(Asn)/Glu-tRNA(Gln) amidotransferase subunit GatC [Anaerovoracaceae bacterium]